MHLTSLDPKLASLAKPLNGTLTKDNSKGMLTPFPHQERSLRWKKGNLEFLIQIFPEYGARSIKNWCLWACCYSSDRKFSVKKTLYQGRELIGLFENFDHLIAESLRFLEQSELDYSKT